MKIIGVIPARYQSTRFPGKPLALIKGVPLVERVWRQAMRSRMLDEVVIATDDRRIAEAACAFGARVEMTSRSCACGTDRIACVAKKLGAPNDIFINIQGDEPLMSPRTIDRLAKALKEDRSAFAATAAFPLKDAADLHNPNVVKVVADESFRALYFSRAPIPYPRNPGGAKLLKHLGIYAYRAKGLRAFSTWKQTPLEKTEGLEQLRILEKGYTMKVVISDRDSSGVDVPDDIDKIERLI